jgi:16S rRNA (cytosine967-C5)-methyltransferase
MAGLAQLQRDMLEALWPLLQPGGSLLYVTCSVLSQENDGLIERFAGEHTDLRESSVLPNYNIRDLMRRKSWGYQVLPGTAGMDGFYFVCLEKLPGNH